MSDQTVVKITDPKHPLCGKTVPGERLFFDVNYTGDGPDLFTARHGGQNYRLLSTQIDEAHYHEQELAQVKAELGANVGDKVLVVADASGTYGRGWDRSVPHVITGISRSGHVTFDDGLAIMFRPKIVLAN